MLVLANQLRYADGRFQGTPGVIATVVLEGPSGIALIDPGPSTDLAALDADLASGGLSLDDVEAVLLTHIHFDHAGATGTIVRRRPACRVYVHERGARHMASPERLLASATRIYGDRMDTLWGEFMAVPEGNLHILRGGEHIVVAGHDIDVAYTPGHAQHHVSYFHRASRIAFVGDTGGCRTAAMTGVMPPTPPPDIDIALWHESVTRILAWQPSALFLTHFGPVTVVAAHLAELLDRLDVMKHLAGQLLSDGVLSEEERQARFIDDLRRVFRRQLSEEELRRLELAVPFDMCWTGLARALRAST
ncbi:MAG: MBL fold metallo-hydrolase [Acidobacteria bacterium]|nr:MBL fold metallo-hydrolase [Acidobacteriota bacterium]